jgi:hypothetical protein
VNGPTWPIWVDELIQPPGWPNTYKNLDQPKASLYVVVLSGLGSSSPLWEQLLTDRVIRQRRCSLHDCRGSQSVLNCWLRWTAGIRRSAAVMIVPCLINQHLVFTIQKCREVANHEHGFRGRLILVLTNRFFFLWCNTADSFHWLIMCWEIAIYVFL